MSDNSPLRLWYKSSAKDWNEALPVGNGALGAMVFGGVERERLALNEDTLWMGGPANYDRPDAHEVLPELRRLLFEGREADASELASRRFMGTPACQTAYQPLGDLDLGFEGSPVCAGYERDLDISTGIATVRLWDKANENDAQEREVFVSAPDKVLVLRIRGRAPHGFRLAFKHAFEPISLETTAGRLVFEGRWVNDGTERPWTADVREPGLRFAVGISVRTDGRSEMRDGECHVRGATETVVLLAAATSFVNYQDVSADPKAIVAQRLKAAEPKGYMDLRERHVNDVSGLMGRVKLKLGDDARAGVPTDERLEAVRRGEPDPGLAALFFQYGRYLLVGSSRPGTQPANLQGIWNADIAPAWGSKWTTNINLQMNYWHAETANLEECHEPLFDLLDDLRVTGARTARSYYGARGWVLHHNADLWRGTAPVDGIWGIWPMGAAWLARHVWDRYLFSMDEEFLRGRAWPVMREAALFLVDFLVEAPPGTALAGRLVTCPSHSPENRYLRPDGSEGLFTYAATMDLMIVRELFESCLAAIAVLEAEEAEAELSAQITDRLARLAPLQISPKTGRLQEWAEDHEDAEPGHRHISHAYALYPGQAITPRRSPGLAQALRHAIDLRLRNGGGGTGWSRAWLVNLFARLGDGDGAGGHLQALLATCVLPNLFDSHPPFQIDGNFGAAAGIAEMLLQSRALDPVENEEFEADILPALPSAWREGEVRGLRARGGFVVGMRWAAGRLVDLSIESRAGKAVTVRYLGQDCRMAPRRGEEVRLQF